MSKSEKESYGMIRDSLTHFRDGRVGDRNQSYFRGAEIDVIKSNRIVRDDFEESPSRYDYFFIDLIG